MLAKQQYELGCLRSTWRRLVGRFDQLCLDGFPAIQAMGAADADGHNAVCPYSGLNYGFKG